MRISEAQKEEIRTRVALEELLPEYNVHLVRAGRQFKALCPFHQEKTPSFWVHPDKQFYHCFGCGAVGDVFRFVQEMEGVGWIQAVQILAARAGVVIELDPSTAREERARLDLFDLHEHAAAFYHQLLLEDPRAELARRYLAERGIDPSMWKRFQLGYSLPEWDTLVEELRRRGAAEQRIEKAGLARRSSGGRLFDQFRGRLMFPISDARNRIVGFGARTLGDDVPKYLNTPQTEIFDKSQILYGLEQAKTTIRREGVITIVEGYTDVIMAHQAGLETFVASLGTAFTAGVARQLHRLAPRVLMVFDGDAAGQRALERSLDLLVAEELDVRIHTVTDGKDPCDAIRLLGGEEFRRRLDSQSTTIFEFKWRMAVDAHGAESPAARARGIDECLRLVARIPNPVNRQLVLRLLTEKAGVPEAELRERYRALEGGRKASASRAQGQAAPADAASKTLVPARLGDLAEVVLECMIALPSRAAEFWSHVPRGVFGSELGDTVANAIDDLLEEGNFTGEALARKLSEDSAAAVWRILARLTETEDARESHDHLWEVCQRDLERWTIQERIASLDRRIGVVRSRGDDEELRRLLAERLELRKRLKRPPRPVAGAVFPIEDVRN